MSLAERARLDEIEAIDPFAYAEEFPDEWRQFRESALTDLLEQLRTALTASQSRRLDLPPALAQTQRRRSASIFRHGVPGSIAASSIASDTEADRRERVLLSPDGVFASVPERLPSVQAAGAGGPR